MDAFAIKSQAPRNGFWGKNCMWNRRCRRCSIDITLHGDGAHIQRSDPKRTHATSLLLHRAHELTAIVDGAAKLNATRAGWSEPETLCPCLPSNNAEAAGGVDRRVTHAVGATGTSAGVRAIGYSLPPSFTRNLFKCCVMQTTLPKF